MKYAVIMEGDKIKSYHILSEKYIKENAGSSSNPLNKGYILMDSIEGVEVMEPVTEAPDDRIKRVVKKMKKDNEI